MSIYWHFTVTANILLWGEDRMWDPSDLVAVSEDKGNLPVQKHNGTVGPLMWRFIWMILKPESWMSQVAIAADRSEMFDLLCKFCILKGSLQSASLLPILRHGLLSLLAQGWTAQASNSEVETPRPRWSWRSCFASPFILPLPLQMRSAWSVIWRCCSWTPKSQKHIYGMELERRGRRSHWRTADTWHKTLALQERMPSAATTAPSTHMAKTAIDRFPRPPHRKCWIIMMAKNCLYIILFDHII